MAKTPISLEQLENASEDVEALGLAVNGDDTTTVTTRLNRTYPTLAKAIKEIFERGGLPATPFATKGLMEASSLTNGDYAYVTDDSVAENNGLYVKKQGAWVKSKYDVEQNTIDNVTPTILNKVENPFGTHDLLLADTTLKDNAYAVVVDDTNDKNGHYQKRGGVWIKLPISRDVLDDILTKVMGKNLFDKTKVVINKYIKNSGVISDATSWSVSDYIPVVAGQTYTISSVSRRVGLAFFADKTVTAIADSYNEISDAVTVVAPMGSNYLVINVDSDVITADKVQVEKGAVATAYEPYHVESVIKKTVLPTDIVFDADLQSAISNIDVIKDYEIIKTSKNLFDASKIKDLQYLKNTGGLSKNSSHIGWSTSDFIPVVAGQTYTLSGMRGRHGLSFFADTVTTDAPLLYYQDLNMPLTVTAPVGANYVVFNIQSPTNSDYSNLQFEKGAVATAYEPYSSAEVTLINPDFIAFDKSSLLKNTLTVEGNTAKIKSNTENFEFDLLLTKPESHNNSTVFNFISDKHNGAVIKTMTDDVAPLRMDNATIGANHGYAKTDITSAAHGKTNADIGSVWSDGVSEFVLIDIISVDKLSVTARNSNTYLTADSLTHVSGATNTATINSTAKVNNQWFPAIKNRKLSVFVDDVKIDTSLTQTYDYKDNVAFHESYEIMAKTDIVEWVILNGKKQLDSYDAVPTLLCNYSYVFDKEGGCTIYSSITAYKTVAFADWMVTQAAKINATNVFYYVPKTIPFSQDAINYDFSKLQAVTAPLPSTILFNDAKNEVDANPVDRLVQFDSSVGFAIGYLPLFDAEPNKRKTNASNKYFEVRGSSLKVYPRLIDGLKTTLAAGDNFAAIAYRKYFKRDTKRTAKYVVRSNVADFLYLDWHTAKTDVVELPDDLIGRKFTVHEKSSNVTLLSQFATNSIAVKIDATKSYGYLVLRFDR